jgi:hypothetical protein
MTDRRIDECPLFFSGLGRWCSRDPIAELARMVIHLAEVLTPMGSAIVVLDKQNIGAIAANAARSRMQRSLGRVAGNTPQLWQYADGANVYEMEGSNPANGLDPTGLGAIWRPGPRPTPPQSCPGNPCLSAPPMPSDSPDPYPPTYTYLGISAYWMFEDAGNNSWANLVRGCLACMFAQGVSANSAHFACYNAATGNAPITAPWGLLHAGVTAGWLGVGQVVYWFGSNEDPYPN